MRLRRLAALVLAGFALACSGGSSGPSPNAVATVDMTPTSVALNVGETRQLAAAPRNAAGAIVAGKSAAWSTSASSVATVSTTGLVSAVGAGNATITATIDGKVGTVSVAVTALPVNTVVVSPALVSIAAGSTQPMTAVLSDANGNTLTGRAIVWSTGNSAVATVGATGVVTGMAAGTTTVTATSEGKSGVATVTVTPNPNITFAASGRIVEAAFTPAIAGARVTAQDANAAFIATATTDANGNWSIAGLPSGSVVQFAVSATGFVSTTTGLLTITASTSVENIPLARTGATAGSVAGTARDAATSAAIGSGIAVELRTGVGVTTGLAVQSTTASATGTYTFSNVAAGTYTITMRGVGYAQASRTIAVSAGAATSNADVSLSASASANQWRAVLSWTAANRDLDLYLTLPGTGSARTQVYFLSPGNCSATPFACLDRDADTAPGPEVITIAAMQSGVYRLYVQNYNAPSSASDSTLMRSGAQVVLYRGTAAVATWNVPQQPGTLWTVAEIDGATGTVTPKNTMAAGAPGDPTVALRASGGGKRDRVGRLP